MENFCKTLKPDDNSLCKDYIRSINANEPGFCKQPTRFRCTEAMKVKLPSISFSSLTDFISCKLRYKHRVVDGLQMKSQHLTEPLKQGRAWDAYLQHLFDGNDYQPVITSLRLSETQQAKINALARARRDLEIPINKDGLLGCQYKIHVPLSQEQVIGYADRAYDDHIIESKLSGRPDFYKQRENLTYQLGTYFMGNEAWQYADVEICRAPYLKLKSNESPEAYEERVYGDILSRPGHYFIGWDRKTRTYGVRFWRSEFDLDEIFRTYVYVLDELKTTLKRGSWYGNFLACHVPAPCQFLPVKKSGVVSSEIFKRKEVRQDEKN